MVNLVRADMQEIGTAVNWQKTASLICNFSRPCLSAAERGRSEFRDGDSLVDLMDFKNVPECIYIHARF